MIAVKRSISFTKFALMFCSHANKKHLLHGVDPPQLAGDQRLDVDLVTSQVKQEL